MANKSSAKRTYSNLCARFYAGKREAERGEELALLEKDGIIKNLEYQPRWILCKSPRITYTADFIYENEDGRIIVEDVKGFLTRDSRTKIAWLKEKYGVEVRL